MPTTETVNTQQLLQMGTLTEKLQHTIQHLPSVTGQQLQDEEVSVNELKQIEIQDPDIIEESNSTNPESRRRREIRLRNKSPQVDELEGSFSKPTLNVIHEDDLRQSQHINLTV